MIVVLENGFNTSVELLEWDGVHFHSVKFISSCTWHDDVKVKSEFIVEGPAAVVTRRSGYYEISLIGFTEEFLDLPSPVKGVGRDDFSAAWKPLRTTRDYLEAVAFAAAAETQGVKPFVPA